MKAAWPARKRQLRRHLSGAHNYFVAKTPAFSHVKPHNPLNHYQATTSAWHVSYLQSGILKTDEKEGPGIPPGLFSIGGPREAQLVIFQYFSRNPIRINILQVLTHRKPMITGSLRQKYRGEGVPSKRAVGKKKNDVKVQQSPLRREGFVYANFVQLVGRLARLLH